MSKANLKFNFGYLLDALPGTSSNIEFDYPRMVLDDTRFEPLHGRFNAARAGEGIYISGDFGTTIAAECARCLAHYQQPITAHADELFYYPPYLAPEGAFVLHEDGNADLGPMVRETLLLAEPMQSICRPDCRGLCLECGQNLNEGTCDCKIDNIDPRLAALKVLLDES